MRQTLGGSLLVGVLQQRIYLDLLVERRDLELVRAGSEDGGGVGLCLVLGGVVS